MGPRLGRVSRKKGAPNEREPEPERVPNPEVLDDILKQLKERRQGLKAIRSVILATALRW